MKQMVTAFSKRFGNNMDSYYKCIFFFVVAVYFLAGFGEGLLKGGRWDLYQNIAMADRFLDGKGLYYSMVEASSPYFPGVAFLAVLVGKLFYPWRDYILLAIASLLGALFFYVLVKMGDRFVKKKWIPLTMVSFYLFTMFGSYRGYMSEFKADTLVLLIGFLLCCIINRIEESDRVGIPQAFGLFILAFAMDVAKQQALYVDIGIGFYVLLQKELKVPMKVKILMPLVLAGLLDLFVIFSIPGIEIIAIKNLSDMPFWGWKNIFAQMGNCFKSNLLFFIFLFIFVFLWYRKLVVLNAFGWMWISVALVFGLGQIIGGWKTGGNAGNYEVGMVNFIPFTLIGAEWVFDQYISEEKKERAMAIGCVCIVCIAGMHLANFGLRRVPHVISKMEEDKKVSEYLSENFGGEEFMYYSDQYMQLIRSDAAPGMDIYTTPSNIREYADMRGEYLKNKTYKYLYVRENDLKSWDNMSMEYLGMETHGYENLNEYYEPVIDEGMPESLQGQLYVAK